MTTQTARPPAPIDRAHDILDGKGPNSDGWYKACCPAHEDTSASLSYREVGDGVYVRCFAGCERSAILKAMGVQEKELRTGDYKPSIHIKKPFTLIELAENKMLPWQELFNYGVTDFYRYYGQDVIRISYKDRNGDEHPKIRVRLGSSGHDQKWEGPGEIIPYGAWKLTEAEQASYLVIPEGESDAWTFWHHSIPALAIPGADMVKCLDRIDLKNTFASIPKIYIIQEPDQAERAASINKSGQGFYANVYKRLRQNGYTGEIFHVNYKRLTGHKDPNEMHQALCKAKQSAIFRDQLLAALDKADPANDAIEEAQNGLQALDKALKTKNIDEMYQAVTALASLPATDLATSERYMREIKEAFGKEVNLNKIRNLLATIRKSQEETERRDMDTVAEMFAEQYGDEWAYDIYGQTWRRFTGTHWAEPISEEDGKTDLDTLFVQLIHSLDIEIKSNSILENAHRLARGRCKRRFLPKARAINFQNGTLLVDIESLQPHNREDNFTYCLDYDFDPSGDYPQTRAFYESVLVVKTEKEDCAPIYIPDFHAIQAVMAQFGLALLGDMKMHRILCMVGATRAGKSTIMRHGNSMCGNMDAYSPNLEGRYGSFAGDTLFFSDLEGKRVRFMRNKQRLVCADEIKPETFRENEGTLKNMSAHSGVDMRGMNKDEQIDNTWRPKLIISANEKPHYRDTAGAIGQRMIYLHTPRQRPEDEQDLNLLNKLIAERGAFVRDCLKLAVAAIDRGYIPKSRNMKLHAHEAEINGNPLKAFIDEYCILDGKAKEHTDKIYQAFMGYRERNGHKKDYAKLTMIAALKEMNIGISPSKNPIRLGGDLARALLGLRLKTETEIEMGTSEPDLQDDQLLLTLRCYDAVTMKKGNRNEVNVASQAALEDSRYDVTINLKNTSVETTFPDKEENTKVGGAIGRIEKKGVTSLQHSVNEPLKPSQPRYDTRKQQVQSVTIVTPPKEPSATPLREF